MKKTLTRRIAGCLAAVLFLLTLAGCSKEPAKASTAAPVDAPGYADLRETDTLVLYYVTEMAALEQERIQRFTALYDIDVEMVGVPAEEWQERVANDLASGSGPDVVFLYQLTNLDIPKAALHHNFLDLTKVLAEDPDFAEDTYVDGVFEDCRIGGRQYTIPLSYEVLYTVSSASKLDELGYREDSAQIMSDYLEELARLTPAAAESTGFQQMLQAKNHFYQLLMNSGIRLIDYEAGEVLPDEKELRRFLEGYRAYFPYDDDGTGLRRISTDGDRPLSWGQCVFWYPLSLDGITRTIASLKNESFDYVLHPISGQTGEFIGNLCGQIAIRSNSPNTLNAYRFIKFLLSEEEQSNPFKLFDGIPIHKESIRKAVYEAPAVEIVNNVEIYHFEERALTEEEAEELMTILTGVDRYVQSDTVTRTILRDAMLPYFQGEDSYKNCLKDLRSKLTFYLSE